MHGRPISSAYDRVWRALVGAVAEPMPSTLTAPCGAALGVRCGPRRSASRAAAHSSQTRLGRSASAGGRLSVRGARPGPGCGDLDCVPAQTTLSAPDCAPCPQAPTTSRTPGTSAGAANRLDEAAVSALHDAMSDFLRGRAVGGGSLSSAAALTLAAALVPPLLSAVDGAGRGAALEQLLGVVAAVAARDGDRSAALAQEAEEEEEAPSELQLTQSVAHTAGARPLRPRRLAQSALATTCQHALFPTRFSHSPLPPRPRRSGRAGFAFGAGRRDSGRAEGA